MRWNENEKKASGQEILYIQKWANDFVFALARCHLAMCCLCHDAMCVAQRKREKGGPTAEKKHREEYKKEIQFLMDLIYLHTALNVVLVHVRFLVFFHILFFNSTFDCTFWCAYIQEALKQDWNFRKENKSFGSCGFNRTKVKRLTKNVRPAPRLRQLNANEKAGTCFIIECPYGIGIGTRCTV